MHEGYSGFSFDDIYDGHEQTQEFCDRWFHRLLFQAMSNKPDLDSQHESLEQDKLSARDPADDEDLILTRKHLEKNNYTRDERKPKVRINLPPVIEVSELPSSKSHDMTGTVPREEFHALLNMLCGLANHTLVDVSQLLETHSTDWQGFEAILAKLEVRGFQALNEQYQLTSHSRIFLQGFVNYLILSFIFMTGSVKADA
ncbi:hypothetical protein F5Y13DRAFT_171101 [Hypoxylon sp. FL1857]|nr:hypothetical protein F5Y13DRAFT_171101 [Hypoxylon sp. FL1857]